MGQRAGANQWGNGGGHGTPRETLRVAASPLKARRDSQFLAPVTTTEEHYVVSDDRFEQGLARLLEAVERAGEDGVDSDARLEEAYDLAHVASAQWEAILASMQAARHLTRRELKLPLADGDGYEGEWGSLPSTDEHFAEAQRAFLRMLAVTMVTRTDNIGVVASELHFMVYGKECAEAPVTWQDYRLILLGLEPSEPTFGALREGARLLRQGHDAATVAERTGLSRDKAHQLSAFLGLRAWRSESKARAARVAVREGWTSAQFAASYNERFEGLDSMSERRAREYLAEARAGGVA